MSEGTKGKIRVRLTGSVIGASADQKATVRALGLKHRGDAVERPDNGAIRGMIRKISHVVEVEEVD